VFNDIVSIILFNTVQGLKENFTFNWKSPFVILGQFTLLALESIGIGLTGGVFSSLMFKHGRCLTHSPIVETIMLFLIAFGSYFLSEFFELSGIISLLTCGITMAHYTWYNLSPQGKTISSVTFSILGSAAEALVFSYIGLCVFTYSKGDDGQLEDDTYVWSPSFIVILTSIIIVGRLIGVWSVHFLLSLC